MASTTTTVNPFGAAADATSPARHVGEDHVRAHTAPEVLEAIDAAAASRVEQARHASPAELDERIRELGSEWDVERLLEVNAATLTFVSSLRMFVSGRRRWALVPMVVGGFLIQHAVSGWCPPLAVFRRFGIRTRAEIEAERWELKVLRGDLDRDLG
jgi:hypothetical protein